MAYVGGRKSLVVFFVVASLFSSPALLADSVSLPQVRNATDAFLMGRSAQPGRTPSGSIRAQATGLAPAGFREVRDDDGTILAYVADLEPRGFIALSADTDIAPVVAYSFQASFPAGDDKANPLYRLLRADMKLRTSGSGGASGTQDAGNRQVVGPARGRADRMYRQDASFQQWPPEGTTSTGGWLETTWGQDEPYNAFCPLDSVRRPPFVRGMRRDGFRAARPLPSALRRHVHRGRRLHDLQRHEGRRGRRPVRFPVLHGAERLSQQSPDQVLARASI